MIFLLSMKHHPRSHYRKLGVEQGKGSRPPSSFVDEALICEPRHRRSGGTGVAKVTSLFSCASTGSRSLASLPKRAKEGVGVFYLFKLYWRRARKHVAVACELLRFRSIGGGRAQIFFQHSAIEK